MGNSQGRRNSSAQSKLPTEKQQFLTTLESAAAIILGEGEPSAGTQTAAVPQITKMGVMMNSRLSALRLK